jgi:uncharacterized protein YbaR (Trm112 family)
MVMPYRGQAQNIAANLRMVSVIMELSAVLLKVLSCPVTGNSLVYDREDNLLVGKKDGLSYPIVDGIPILLTSAARKV